jgi:hypothetical protein
MATPLKIKDGSGNIQEMTTSDENYIAYQMGLHLAGAGTTEPGSLNKAASGTAVGSYDNTFFNEPVGTHPSTSISTGTTTTNIHQTTGTAAETNANIETPLQWVDAGGETGFKAMPSAALSAAVDRYLSTIFTGEYPGSYRIATAAPSSDWSIAINSAVTDTRTDGTSVPYHIYKRQTMTAPATKRPLYDRDGDGQNLKAMSDDQIKWSFGQRAKTRMSSTAIGTFQLRNSSQGAPTDTGTWVAKGVALDTKQTTSQGNFQSTSTLAFNTTYTRGYENAFSTNYISTTNVDYQSTKAINYTNTYEGSFANIQSESFNRPYDKAYTQDYIKSYTTGYTGTYNKVYLGTYDNTFTTDYQSTKAINYVGTYSGAFNASYTKGYDRDFSANYTTTYTGAYDTAYNKNVNYDNTFNASYVRGYGIRYDKGYAPSYETVYQSQVIRLYGATYVGPRPYDRTVYYTKTDTITYTRDPLYDGVSAYLGGSVLSYQTGYISSATTFYTGVHYYNWGVMVSPGVTYLGVPTVNQPAGSFFDLTSFSVTTPGESRPPDSFAGMTFGLYSGMPEDDAGNRWDFYAYWDGTASVQVGENSSGSPQYYPRARSVKGVAAYYIAPGTSTTRYIGGNRTVPASSFTWVQGNYLGATKYSNSTRRTHNFQRAGFYLGYYQGVKGYGRLASNTYTVYYENNAYESPNSFISPASFYTAVYDGPGYAATVNYTGVANFNANYASTFQRYYTDIYDGAAYIKNYDNTSTPYDTAYVNTYASAYNRVDNYTSSYSTDFNTNYTTAYTNTFSTNYVNTYEGAFDGAAYNTVYTGNYVTNYDKFFESSFATNYEGPTFNTNYDNQYAIDYTSTYTNTYTGLYTSDYTGAFDRAYNTVYTGNYVNTYTGDYTATYDNVFEAGYIKDYIADYLGDFSGLQIDATSETNETYTLYVRIA